MLKFTEKPLKGIRKKTLSTKNLYDDVGYFLTVFTNTGQQVLIQQLSVTPLFTRKLSK